MTNMKSLISSIQKTVYWFFTILIVQIGCFSDIYAQDHSINGSIAKYRKGELIVNAKPGDKVTVEQLRHEFWFGCAIPNSLAGGHVRK